MRKIYSSVLLSVFLLLQAGCSIQPSQVVIVDKNSLKDRTNIACLSPHKTVYPDSILDKNRSNASQRDADFGQVKHCRVKYHLSYGKNCWAIVNGTLRGGKTYPVILDTGASATIVNDTHIRENKLTFYPFRNNAGAHMNWGMCDLGGLSIGEMNLPVQHCYYQQRHAEVQLFGLPIFKDKAIVVGLPALRQLKYVEFDNLRREVGFSFDRTFEPHEPAHWTHYSFMIEEDLKGNSFLFVSVPIAGKETTLQLDTGNGGGLAVGTRLWEQLRKRIQVIKLTEGKDLYPYIGNLACKRGVIPKLEVGDRILKNVKLSIFPDESPIMEGCEGLVGMQCFENTVMVLDFEKNLMWVNSSSPGQLHSIGL